MRIFQKIKSTKGDTIVEVLISLLVISAILVGAFVLSQRSSRNVRDAQEHSEALGLLQSQVELLRSAATTSPTFNFAKNGFCMDANANQVTSGCTQPPRYLMNIENQGNSGAKTPYTYKFTVTWPSINGGNAQESILYRVGS